MKIRDGFRVPPIHKGPTVEGLLGRCVEMMQLQALQIECLKRCVGQDRYDAELKAMNETPPEQAA